MVICDRDSVIAASGALKRELDGKPVGHVIYPPYVLEIGKVDAGKHQLDFTLLNTRENAFGPLHRTEYSNTWIGPDAWRTENSFWTESYRLTPAGIRTAPLVEELSEK